MIEWVYDVAKQKVQKKVGSNIKWYVNGVEYATENSSAPTLEAIYHEEGRAVPTGNNWQYEYTLKDIWGNGRVYFTDKNGDGAIDLNINTSDEILQTDGYYPFGLVHSNSSNVQVGVVNQYKHQEQERQPELGWDMFKYRTYDPSIGRFLQLDPLSEDYVYNSTYAFQENKIGLGRELEGLELREFDDKELTAWERALKTENSVRAWNKFGEDASKIFKGSVSLQGRLAGGELKGQLGPIKAKAEANLGRVKGSINQENVKVSADGVFVAGSASFGNAEAKVSGKLLNGEIAYNYKEESIEIDGKILDGSASAKVKDGNLNLGADDSFNIGGGVGLSVLKAEGTVNLKYAAKSYGSLVTAVGETVSSYLNERFNLPLLPNKVNEKKDGQR